VVDAAGLVAAQDGVEVRAVNGVEIQTPHPVDRINDGSRPGTLYNHIPDLRAADRARAAAAAAGGPPAPGVTSLRRAVRETLSPGERSACAGASRPRGRTTSSCSGRPRNTAWEADHVEASVEAG
jgi:hypothetical protein